MNSPSDIPEEHPEVGRPNPYEAGSLPQVDARRGGRNRSKRAIVELRNAALFVAACSFAGGTMGVLIGVGLGILVPDYYRTVIFSDVDPVAVGVGLGITQGFAGGAVVGLILVALYYWKETRSPKS